MSNLIEDIMISRSSSNGSWTSLCIYVAIYNSDSKIFNSVNVLDRNEDEALTDLMANFARDFSSESLRRKIIQEFLQMRQNNLNIEIGLIQLAPEDQLEPHFSCKKTSNNDYTEQTQEENKISHSELKQKLENLNKDSEIMKFFVENKCSVCLSSYKEILDDNLHIVIPTCGHPLCCQCADNILMSEKKECPRCRGNITADSFDLMKFNADLELDSQDQNVFL